jgi:fumarate reductase iron-sulfur subunit
MGAEAAASDDTLAVEIWRGGEAGRFERYEVPRRPSQTVLDIVTWVQRHLEPTLAYRFACRVGMCGSCAMMVNGKPRWTCRTHVDKVASAGRLEIAPLRNLPRIRDLVTDMAGFFDKNRQAMGRFVAGEPAAPAMAPVRPEDPARQAIDAGIECIGCGVCHAACDVVAWKPGYLGPAALNRAWTLVNDERDAAGAERLRAVTIDGGCTSCHSMGSCAEACPKHINPTRSIAGLKRLAAGAAFRGGHGPR